MRTKIKLTLKAFYPKPYPKNTFKDECMNDTYIVKHVPILRDCPVLYFVLKKYIRGT
jgi:hypothetical protein